MQKNLDAHIQFENDLQVTLNEKWLTENKKGLEDCNELTEKYGLFADKYRVF